MKPGIHRIVSFVITAVFVVLALFLFMGNSRLGLPVSAQTVPTPTPAIVEFDQNAALATLRERIKGKEKEPSASVFKDIRILKDKPAGALLAIMEMGFSRSLGVTCTHCHIADKWESDEKPQKQIARDMWAMAAKINGDLLNNIKNLKSASPTVNCTTCHRGQITPAVNLPMPAKS